MSHEELTDPHSLFGRHGDVVRVWRPGSNECFVEIDGQRVAATRVDEKGLFEAPAGKSYRVFLADGRLTQDPYTFSPTIGSVDEHLFNKGCHYEVYDVLGAQLRTHEGVEGVSFAVWAPNAKGVAVVGDFNQWDGRMHPMRMMGSSGIWELFVPGVGEGERYKFEVRQCDGQLAIKSDPFAFWSELRPGNASRTFDVNRYQWQHKRPSKEGPMSIYEVHLASWKGGVSTYRELAVELSRYCKKMAFTHIELLPVTEHPLDESWGYQTSGYFAATSRFGSPEDFQWMVDHFHGEGIGVILDWVPGHFPTDPFSLSRFDGTCLYEHEDTRKGFHPQWNTLIFNYGRYEVSNFLIGSALFWLEKMGVDGFRVDAVASMLYLDFGRDDGNWEPNAFGGRENLEAIEFLKHMNSVIHERCPYALTIAEESSTYPGVTHKEGLGFDYKWNMGWMNDTLSYFQTPAEERPSQHHHLTFGITYAFSERFLLPLSHDEVVHLKKSLLGKMPEPKFPNLRLLYSYMVCHVGKHLLFMGGEMGQPTEWDCKGEVPWHLLEEEEHRSYQEMVAELNILYQEHSDLWGEEFNWIDCEDIANSVISYTRGRLVCVHNFGDKEHERYTIQYGQEAPLKQIFSSSGISTTPEITRDYEGKAIAFTIALPPLTTLIFA